MKFLKNSFAVLMCLGVLGVSSCKKDKDPVTPEPEPEKINTIPEFYKADIEANYGTKEPVITFIAGEESKISVPQDLDFNTLPNRPNELWIINKGTINSGATTVMLTNVGEPTQNFDHRQDGNAWHFMNTPSAMSFSNNGNWATVHNIQDANHAGGTYTGPSLWSSDLSVYAQYAGPGSNGSHLDMLHGSPFGMGIENHRDNAFWVFDGYHSQIVYYDFVDDHGPGQHDHSDGKVHRYTDFEVKRDPLVPSHLVLDKDKKWLYIVDGGNKRILRMDVTTAKYIKTLPLINEPLAQHFEMGKTDWEVFVDASAGLFSPCGIELVDNRLFVSDNATGEIICYNIESKKELGRIKASEKGIMGIKIGPDNKLYFVNAETNTVNRVDPS